MYFDTMSSEEQVAYLIKPILKALKAAGGQMERSELRDSICESDDRIAEFAQVLTTSKYTGKQYKKFNWRFNFAVNELAIVGFVSYGDSSPMITLTEQGTNIDLSAFDEKAEVCNKARAYWDEQRAKNKQNHVLAASVDGDEEDEESSADELLDDFKIKLQSAIANLSPAKFEQFSRALLTKMGVQFTDKGTQITNDGGIDGYGYHLDSSDFRTTRVVIQCKRFNSSAVTELEINQFLGAMNKFKADYGVFITNGRFTNKARDAAREGSPITLIDGNELIKLVIKYQLYITPVTTFVLDDFYREN